MQEKCEIINPYDIGDIPQQTKIVSLNYTNQDFYSMKARLINFIKERSYHFIASYHPTI